VVHTEVEGCPRLLPLDTFLLWLILSNLIANACKFAPAAAKHMYLTCDASGIEIRVVDHGPGIDPRERKHVFEPFFRGTDTQHIEGLGMGLSIVQEAVSLLDGSIEVQSQPGQTCVAVRLPWLKQDESP
jgi:signal transduction histidine kinase